MVVGGGDRESWEGRKLFRGSGEMVGRASVEVSGRRWSWLSLCQRRVSAGSMVRPCFARSVRAVEACALSSSAKGLACSWAGSAVVEQT